MIDADSPDRFAALKSAFADLCERDAVTRARELDALRVRDADFAQALSALFERFDERDLQPPDAALEHLRFGPFHVLRRLGSGGMGEVFLAARSDAGFEQQVALKRVRHTALSGDLTVRFLRERQLLARLQHPGIARLIDGGVDADGRPWLAMDYVEGLTLLRHARTHALALPARLALMRQVCAAVAYAHRNLVVHRDLKPANVLVTPEGDAKLLDFGIAKLLDDSDANATQLDQRAHTVRYAAPEQLTGDRTTTATDVHALGLLLYELVADAPPFARAASGEIDWHRAILDDAPQPLGEALRARRGEFTRGQWRRITGDLDRIVRKALAKHAADRYASVASLDADLEDWLAARPLRSGIGGARAQTRYLLARYRWPLALAGGVLLAFGIGAVLALQQARRANEQAAAANAHLETLLGVLGSANPQKYAAAEPSAADFLRAAAQLLQARSAEQPVLVRRALAEIGAGLLNFGREGDAESALQQAWLAAAHDPGADAAAKLGILGLLMHAQDVPDGASRARRTAAQIEALVHGGAPDAQAIDALGRAGGIVGKSGDFVFADRLFALAQARIAAAGATALPSGVLESFWRQRGWSALRAARNDVALDALQRARAQVDAAPDEFSPLRRAEGDALLGEAQLAAGLLDDAATSLQRAGRVFHAEYPATHAERAAFDLRLADLALARGDSVGAVALLDVALPLLRAAPVDDYAGDTARAAALYARVDAQSHRCDAAYARLREAHAAHAAHAARTAQPMLPRDVKWMAMADSEVAATCSANASTPEEIRTPDSS